MPWLVVLIGCGPDLPPGFEGAERVDVAQSDCEESPYDTGYEEAATAEVAGGAIAVAYDPVTFRCEQDVEGFWLEVDGRLDVLVQPIQMNPKIVAGCDCAYTVTMSIPTSTPATVSAWRRWDSMGGEQEPVLIDEIPL